MKLKKYQSGSGYLIIIIALVVVLLGVLGFVLWQNFMQPKDSDKNNSTTTTASTTTITIPDNNDGYLVLEDWNVKFKLPSDLDSNVITYEKANNSWGESYNFSTERVSALGGDCANLYQLYRQTEPIDYVASAPVQVGQFGGYYYYVSGRQSVCSELDAGTTHTDIVYPDMIMLMNFLTGIEENI